MDQLFLLLLAFTTISTDEQPRSLDNLPSRRRNPQGGCKQTQALAKLRAVACGAERDAQALRRVCLDGEGVAADHCEAGAQERGDEIFAPPFGGQPQPDVMAGAAGGKGNAFQSTRREL